MSDIRINTDFTLPRVKRCKKRGNKKHKEFNEKRELLQQNGHLCAKQCLTQNRGPRYFSTGAGDTRLKKHRRRAPPSTAADQHDTSSSHSLSAELASTSGSQSLTITVKNTDTNTGQSTAFFKGPLKQEPTPLSSTVRGNPLKYVAIDCEMVGTGHKGSVSELARCSIVSYDGDVVYDKYIKPSNPVTDLRTRWSGITWSHLSRATPFADAKKEILKILSGKVVIGHAIHNDFRALAYGHPANMTRDTARIPLLNQMAGFGTQECASLKRLTKAVLHRDIQTGKRGHSSVEDAKATMELYKMVENDWERTLTPQS